MCHNIGLFCVWTCTCVCLGGGGCPWEPELLSHLWARSCLTGCPQGNAGIPSLPCPTIADAGQCQACTWVLESELRSYVAQHFTLLSHHHRPRKGCFLMAVSVKDQQVTHKLLYSTAEMQVTIPKSCGHALSDCVGHGGLKPVILSTLSASIGVCQHAHFTPHTFFCFQSLFPR